MVHARAQCNASTKPTDKAAAAAETHGVVQYTFTPGEEDKNGRYQKKKKKKRAMRSDR